MFKIIIASSLLLNTLMAVAQQGLIVQFPNSANPIISVDSINKIVFNGNNLVVNLKNKTQQTFDISAISLLRFGKYTPPSGINVEQTAVNNIQLWPNPCIDQLNIAFDSNDAVSKVIIMNALGQMQASYSFINQNQVQINILSLHVGVYWVQISSQSGNSIHKIVKK